MSEPTEPSSDDARPFEIGENLRFRVGNGRRLFIYAGDDPDRPGYIICEYQEFEWGYFHGEERAWMSVPAREMCRWTTADFWGNPKPVVW